jgi:hypothetical protein
MSRVQASIEQQVCDVVSNSISQTDGRRFIEDGPADLEVNFVCPHLRMSPCTQQKGP